MSSSDDEESYSSPSALLSSRTSSFRSRPYTGVGVNHYSPNYSTMPDVNEVYPGLFVGDAVAAKDKAFLRRKGINYVLNTAEGKQYTQVDTGHLYYRDCPGLRYKGFQIMDLPTTDISKYFHIAANFIDEGISRGGRVLVHCMVGVSRSATCAIAFLMIKRGMTFTQAVALVRTRRVIHPNDGFIRQLLDLDRELRVYLPRQHPLTLPLPSHSLSLEIGNRHRVRSLDRAYTSRY